MKLRIAGSLHRAINLILIGSIAATFTAASMILFSLDLARADEAVFSPISGTDSTAGTVAPLTSGDLGRILASDDSRMASNAAWPGTGAFDESKFIEFAFDPRIPGDATLSSMAVTHEYRRNAILAGAKLEIWDGDAWHDIPLELPSATASDISETKDITSIISSTAVANALKIRFLAYRNTAAVSATTSHDIISVSIAYSVPMSESAATPILTPTPSPSESPSPSATPTESAAPSPSPSESVATSSPTPSPSPTPTSTPASSPTPTPAPAATSTPSPSPSFRAISGIIASSPLLSSTVAALVTQDQERVSEDFAEEEGRTEALLSFSFSEVSARGGSAVLILLLAWGIFRAFRSGKMPRT